MTPSGICYVPYYENTDKKVFKELETTFVYSNANEPRYYMKDELINGRSYIKTGTLTATTIVCLVYKNLSPSVELCDRYITLIGVARQNPGDIVLDEEVGVEVATENALINPVMVLKTQTKPKTDAINTICEGYVETLPKQFIKTKQELGKNVHNFIRSASANNSYYSDYYAEYVKAFGAKTYMDADDYAYNYAEELQKYANA